MPLIVIVDFIGVLIEAPELLGGFERVKPEKEKKKEYRKAWKRLIKEDNRYFEGAVIDPPARELWFTLLSLVKENVIEPPIIFLGGLSNEQTIYERMKTCITRLLGDDCQIKADISYNKMEFLAELSKERDCQASRIVLIDDNKKWTDTHQNTGGTTFHFLRESFQASDLRELLLSSAGRVEDKAEGEERKKSKGSYEGTTTSTPIEPYYDHNFDPGTKDEFEPETLVDSVGQGSSLPHENNYQDCLYTVALMFTKTLAHIADLETGVGPQEEAPYSRLSKFFEGTTPAGKGRANTCLALAYMEYIAFPSLVKASCCMEEPFQKVVDRLGLLDDKRYSGSAQKKFVREEASNPAELHMLMMAGIYMFFWRYDKILRLSMRDELTLMQGGHLAENESTRLEHLVSYGKEILDACDKGRYPRLMPIFTTQQHLKCYVQNVEWFGGKILLPQMVMSKPPGREPAPIEQKREALHALVQGLSEAVRGIDTLDITSIESAKSYNSILNRGTQRLSWTGLAKAFTRKQRKMCSTDFKMSGLLKKEPIYFVSMAVASSIKHLTDLAREPGVFPNEDSASSSESGSLSPARKKAKRAITTVKELRLLIVELLLLLLDTSDRDVLMSAVTPLAGWAWNLLLPLLATSGTTASNFVCVSRDVKDQATRCAYFDLGPGSELKDPLYPEFFHMRNSRPMMKDDGTGYNSQEDKRSNEESFKKFSQYVVLSRKLTQPMRLVHKVNIKQGERHDAMNRPKYMQPVHDANPLNYQLDNSGIYKTSLPIQYKWYVSERTPKSELALEALRHKDGESPGHLHVEELGTVIIADKIARGIRGCLTDNLEVDHFKRSNTIFVPIKPLKWRKRSREEHDGGLILSPTPGADISYVAEWASAQLGQVAFMDLVFLIYQDIIRAPGIYPGIAREGEPCDTFAPRGEALAMGARYLGSYPIFSNYKWYEGRKSLINGRNEELLRMDKGQLAEYLRSTESRRRKEWPFLVHGYTYEYNEAIPAKKQEECACLAACLGAQRLVKLCDAILQRPETYVYKGAPDIVFYRKDVCSGSFKPQGIRPAEYSHGSKEACMYRSVMRGVNKDVTSPDDRAFLVNPNGGTKMAQKCLKQPWLHDNIFAVEVKSANDTLSDVQMCWLQLLRDEVGMHAEVLRVDEQRNTPVGGKH